MGRRVIDEGTRPNPSLKSRSGSGNWNGSIPERASQTSQGHNTWSLESEDVIPKTAFSNSGTVRLEVGEYQSHQSLSLFVRMWHYDSCAHDVVSSGTVPVPHNPNYESLNDS